VVEPETADAGLPYLFLDDVWRDGSKLMEELGLLLFNQNSNIRKQLVYVRTNIKPPLFGGKASGHTNVDQNEEKPKAEEPLGEGGPRETEGKRGEGDYKDISPRLEALIMASEFRSPKTPYSASIPPILECLDPPIVR